MIACTQTVFIRDQWALAFLTHCGRHRTPLRERCPVCFIDHPILPMTKPTTNSRFGAELEPLGTCWKCGSSLLLYNLPNLPSLQAAKVIDLENSILAATGGHTADKRWTGGASSQAFIESIRTLMHQLTMPTDGPLPLFFRIAEAHPRLRYYIFGRPVLKRESTLYLGIGASCLPQSLCTSWIYEDRVSPGFKYNCARKPKLSESLSVHELSAVNGYSPRFKYSATAAVKHHWRVGVPVYPAWAASRKTVCIRD